MFTRVDRLVLSPTDLTTFMGCVHATSLDLEVAWGRRPRPAVGVDEQLALIAGRGMAHEQDYLRRLVDAGLEVREIPRLTDPLAAEAATVEAMRDGAAVVYQGTFFDGRWLGRADFLIRRDGVDSDFGDWAYDLVDTKLARHLSVAAVLQLATYAQRLEQVQGVAPQRLSVVAGDGAEHVFRLADVAAYAARARASLEAFVAESRADAVCTEPVPVPACSRCRWQEHCRAEWDAADDLSLVAGMRHGHRGALRAAGVRDVVSLAEHSEGPVPGLGRAVYERLRRQAQIQVQERADGVPRYALLPHVPGKGLAALPAPDPGDLYLDFEGDPFAGDGTGREYLAGVLTRDRTFHTWWAHDEAGEARLVEDLLRFLVARWQEYPGMRVYHYAPYEQSALKRLTARYGVAEGELDMLLRGGRLVDLYQVVRQGVIIGKSSYSIKKMEDLYWGHVRHGEGDEVADAMSSVVEYERYLAGGEPEILERIAEYNRQDVLSTLDLHDWLEARRADLVAEVEQDGGFPVLRPGEVALEETALNEAALAEEELAGRLLAAGEALCAGLVGWHRREDRPEWWDFFRRAECADDDLVEESVAVGRLGQPQEAGVKLGRHGRPTSRMWRYAFPPQSGKVEVGSALYDVDARTSCGTVTEADLDEGWLVLSRKASADPARPRAVMPQGPLDNKVVRGALFRQAEALLAGEETSGVALLRRRVPTDLSLRDGEETAAAVVRVGAALDGQVLAVQGPPGAGKTYAASHLVRRLLDDGRRVGVTAQSHAVIRNLLTEIGRPALHKVTTVNVGEQDPHGVLEVADTKSVATALSDGSASLVGGTAWLWAREEFAGIVDVLVVDEAGQFSLANALAVAGAARSLVLLGDPQQLTQPTKAEHPYGAGVSALSHLIGEHDVIPADRGFFLERTFRMHPEVTAFVSRLSYDGRLHSAQGREQQEVLLPEDSWQGLPGSGLRHVPVQHQGNVAESREEAAVVADLVAELLRGRWRDHTGQVHAMAPEDILVVAPFNAHVARLRSVLPDEVRVGTVDAFQGQQAPVVLYVTGSSSAADAPRGVPFLYDVHRLNVAVSRARALAIWVGSPALLDAAVTTPEQVRLVNALCAFVDGAAVVLPPGPAAG